jgi:arylsulfatase A-like enzyme
VRQQVDAKKPFFLFLNHMEAHAPYAPSEEWAAPMRRGAPDDPAANEGMLRQLVYPESMVRSVAGTRFTDAERARLDDLYDGDLLSMDAALGRLVTTLREQGVLDRTLFIVAADHGEGLGDHSWIEHTVGVWAEQLRVPLLVRLPGSYDGGRVVDDLVRIEDIVPTVLEACGVALPDDLDGTALDHDLPGRIAFGAQDPMPGGWPRAKAAAPALDMTRLGLKRRSVTDGRWHLITHGSAETLLFDLAADPRELRDVAQEHTDVVTRLRGLLDASPTR